MAAASAAVASSHLWALGAAGAEAAVVGMAVALGAAVVAAAAAAAAAGAACRTLSRRRCSQIHARCTPDARHTLCYAYRSTYYLQAQMQAQIDSI